MIPARLQYVTRILRRLPPRSNLLYPFARFSCTPRIASKQSKDSILEFPPILKLNMPGNPNDYEGLPVSKQYRQIFEDLDIGLPSRDLRSVLVPKNIRAASKLMVRCSLRHVMRTHDLQYFTEVQAEHPKTVLLRHSYGELKKTRPLWLWFYGLTSTDTPFVVSSAKRRMKRALHAALNARGYDAQGRIIESGYETGINTTFRGDLRGTIACIAKVPRDVAKTISNGDLRAAMDAVVDSFIGFHAANQAGGGNGPRKGRDQRGSGL